MQMTIFGVSAWRFALGVIASEAIPVLLLVLAMVPVGMKLGAQPSRETAAAWGAWIGPIGGALAACGIAWLLARSSLRPMHVGIALGAAVGLLDLGLIAAQREPFRWLFAISVLSRVIGGAIGGYMAGRSGPGG
jgi:hypothetical protein